MIRETADYYEQFDKPVLITEFGGSSMGAGLNHLKQELHAALWTSTSTLLAGTPLFWWWQVIDEQNLYDYYQPLSRFMRDLDRRDPDLRPTRMNLHLGIDDAVSPEQIDSVSLATGTRAVGWIFIPSTFAPNATALEHPIENLSFSWVGCSNSVYRIAFWDTSKGQPIRQIDQQAEQRRLRVKVPPLRRDMAFKIFPRPSVPDSLSTSPPQPEE